VSDLFADMPNLEPELFQKPDTQQLFAPQRTGHPPRFLVLYGSLRERSYSRLTAEEAARILTALGSEVRMFAPSGLPLVDHVQVVAVQRAFDLPFALGSNC